MKVAFTVLILLGHGLCSLGATTFGEFSPLVGPSDRFIDQMRGLDLELRVARTKAGLLSKREGATNRSEGSKRGVLRDCSSVVSRIARFLPLKNSRSPRSETMQAVQVALQRTERVIDEHIRIWMMRNDLQYSNAYTTRAEIDRASDLLAQISRLVESRSENKISRNLDSLIDRARTSIDQIERGLKQAEVGIHLDLRGEFDAIVADASSMKQGLGGYMRLLRTLRHVIEDKMNDRIEGIRKTFSALRD